MSEKTNSAEEILCKYLGEHWWIMGKYRRLAINAAEKFSNQQNIELLYKIAYMEAQNKELTKALKSTIPILEYFDRGLADVAEGSGEDQPMHKETKMALTKVEQALKNKTI